MLLYNRCETFLYWYIEYTPTNTVDFIKKVLNIINTNLKKFKLVMAWNLLIIRSRTPRHNGKVERSHRNDNERFYSFLSFYSLEDLIIQGKRYMKRSNNIPMQVLNSLSPYEMRIKLLNS